MSDDEPLSPDNRYEVEDEDEESEEEENNESQASNIERDASSSPEREVEEILFGEDVPSEDEEGEDLINDNMFQYVLSSQTIINPYSIETMNTSQSWITMNPNTSITQNIQSCLLSRYSYYGCLCTIYIAIAKSC
jgi:hypothetical protein